MGTIQLRMAIAACALAWSAAAPAQMPGAAAAAPPVAIVTDVTVPRFTDIALKDDSGTVRVTMRIWQGEAGKRLIQFIDPNNMVINTISEAQPAPVVAANPLSGDPLPPVILPDEPADGVADIRFLQRQIDSLRRQLNDVVNRINAAASQ